MTQDNFQSFNLSTFCIEALMSHKLVMIGLDKNLHILLFNRAAEHYFGLKASECLGQHYNILSHYIDLAPLADIFSKKRLIDKLTVHQPIFTQVVQHHHTSSLTWSIQKIIDKDEFCSGFLLEGQIIQIPTEKSFPDFTHLLNSIKYIPGSLYIKDLNGRYLWVNDYVVNMAGKKSMLDVIGKTDEDFYWKEAALHWKANDREVIQTKSAKFVEEKLTLLDGTVLPLLSSKAPVFNEEGKIIGVAGNSVDITSQKGILYYLTKFANAFPGSLYFKDLDGKYLWCNDFVIEKAGATSLTEIVGKTDFEICWKHLAEHYRENDLEVMRTKLPKTMEETLILFDGTKVPLLTIKKPVFDEKGEVIGVMGNSLDITSQKMIEEALREAKEKADAANLSKTQFIANVSHDIRTPLAGIYGLSEMLLNKVSKKDREDVEDILKSSDRLLKFLNEIIDLAKLDAQEVVSIADNFNFFNLLNEVKELFVPTAKQKNITLNFDYDPSLPVEFQGDEKAIHRILINLIANALKFTAKGGVRVSVSLDQTQPSVENNTVTPVKIAISDTGIGIPKKHLEKIFERFHRVHPSYEGKYKGTGLGLYMTKYSIEELGGKIWVESKLGKGSTFFMTLPLSQPKAMPAIKKDKVIKAQKKRVEKEYISSVKDDRAAQTPPRKKKVVVEVEKKDREHERVLVVEDALIAQKVAKFLLEGLGMQVDVADSGEMALAAVEKNQYVLILMDLGLPDMSGLEIAQKIRQLTSNPNFDVPIIALTAHQSDQVRNECMEAGMSDAQSKPLTEALAKELVERYCQVQ
ncbi:MAG: arcB 2 [Gammaproteobacteria bacterium]|nr:arcB 2 [Gammaproteobacteria bacterium]